MRVLGPRKGVILWVSHSPTCLSLFYRPGKEKLGKWLFSFPGAFSAGEGWSPPRCFFLCSPDAPEMWVLVSRGVWRPRGAAGARAPSTSRACGPGLCAPRLATWDAASQGPGEQSRKAAWRHAERATRFSRPSRLLQPLLHFGFAFPPPGLDSLGAWGPDPAAGARKLLY